MKFKIAPNSLFAVLLRNPWWISILIAVVISLICLAVLPKDLAIFGMMGSFPFVVTGFVAMYRQWSAPSQAQIAAQHEKAAGQTWKEFSKDLEVRFVAQGFFVERLPPPTVEGRADFRLRKAGQTTLVAAKRYKAAMHGVEHVQALLDHKKEEGADAAMLVCLAALSEQAEKLARVSGLTVGLPSAQA